MRNLRLSGIRGRVIKILEKNTLTCKLSFFQMASKISHFSVSLPLLCYFLLKYIKLWSQMSCLLILYFQDCLVHIQGLNYYSSFSSKNYLYIYAVHHTGQDINSNCKIYIYALAYSVAPLSNISILLG